MGNEYSQNYISKILHNKRINQKFNLVESPTSKQIAEWLDQGKICARFSGQMEFGQRALGNRSILMNPKLPNAKEKINLIKKRENYRPFGCSILKELALDYFDVEFENDYMSVSYTHLTLPTNREV